MDTLIAENFIYDQTLDKTVPDSNRVVFKQKHITPIIDQARGGSEYISGKVIVDAQSFGNGAEIPDWANAYFTIPEVETLVAKGASTISTVAGIPYSYLTAPKNNALVESFRCEQGGNMIVSESQNLSHIVNFKKHCMTSLDELNKHGADTLYYPDSVGNWSATANLQGVKNAVNLETATMTGAERLNNGLLARQRAGLPMDTVSNVFTDAAKRKEEQLPYQKITSITSIADTNTTISEIHRLRTVYLRDLDDYFAKHPLVRGNGYKFTLTLNQGSVEATTATLGGGTTLFNTAPTIAATTLTGPATCMPSMLCIGPNTLSNAATCANAASIAITLTLTSKIDISVDARQQGIILYVPTYIPTEEYEAKLLATPQVYRNPFKITSNVFTSLTANAPINIQLFSAIANPRALVVIPQLAQATQSQPSQCSPLNPSPGCTDPSLSLTKFQIRVNSKTVLPAPQSYSFQQFIENTSRIFSVNGGLSSVSSGVIDFWKFMHNYRYYAFDLSYLPDDQRDVPQLISLEAFNNNLVMVDLYVFCLSEQGAVFDLVKGGVEIK